ncbi:acyltransferase family protein, partial [Limosilactobacillus vaginalis]|uniref:acyltransferase family protein n=2 Tax=Limosilactobacillus vaginalis TaxID=1633 RepID=UPI00070523DD
VANLFLKFRLQTKLLVPTSLKTILLPFPLPSGYWFVYAYVIMLFAMPFLNIIINSLNKPKLILLIKGLTFLWSILVVSFNIFSGKPDTSLDNFGYTQTTFFFLLYFIAAYVRKYSGKILNSKKYTAIGSVVGLLLAVVCACLADSQKLFNGILNTFDINGPIVIATSVFIFSFFRNCQFDSQMINYIAGSMFGVYLIHEDSFVRPIIWNQLISSKLYIHSGLEYLTAGLIFSLLVFIICIIIDIVCRRIIFSKVINKLTVYICTLLITIEKRTLNDSETK